MAKPKKAPISPQEFFALPTSKKAHVLALAYMATCTTEGFSKKSLFALRNYFGSKVGNSDWQIIYDYIYGLSEVTPCNLYDIFENARRWQLQLRMQSNKPIAEIEQYPSLLSFIKE